MEIFGSLATIVGLIYNFKSGRKEISDDEYKDFLAWLETKRHNSIIEELHSNHKLGLSIKCLLRESYKEIIDKIEKIDTSLLFFASKIDGFKEIAEAIRPDISLSEQCLELLRRMNDEKNYLLAEVPCLGRVRYGTADSDHYRLFLTRSLPNSGFTPIDLNWIENIEYKFIQDDINTLISLGFVTEKKEHYGGRVFGITRSAEFYLGTVR